MSRHALKLTGDELFRMGSCSCGGWDRSATSAPMATLDEHLRGYYREHLKTVGVKLLPVQEGQVTYTFALDTKVRTGRMNQEEADAAFPPQPYIEARVTLDGTNRPENPIG